MKVLGREVEMVGLPLAQMMELDPKRFVLAYEIFGQHTYVSNEKLLRDVPGMEAGDLPGRGPAPDLRGMERRGTVPDSSKVTWEDEIIAHIARFRKGFFFAAEAVNRLWLKTAGRPKGRPAVFHCDMNDRFLCVFHAWNSCRMRMLLLVPMRSAPASSMARRPASFGCLRRPSP